MGVMIIPFISSLSDDVINAVPQALRDAAFGLGSTKSEAVRQVCCRRAPGDRRGGDPRGVPRGRRDNDRSDGGRVGCEFVCQPVGRSYDRDLTDRYDSVGDQEFESAKTLSAFALALMLIVTTGPELLRASDCKKYREQYE